MPHAQANPDGEEFNDFLSVRNFEQVAKLVNRYAGIQLPASKKQMVEGRLRKRARFCGRKSIDDYCRYLLKDGGFDAEFPHLVDVMTTNKTDFFREPDHFDVLRRAVPSVLQSRPADSVLKIWSAACSTGAEPYTIAMVLAELSSDRHFRFAVLGTDICSQVLEEARRAVYSAETIAPVSEALQRRYVMRARSTKSEVRITPELRKQVRFEHLNLMDDHYPVDRDVDVIFLRNVLIYFEKVVQRRVVDHLLEHLRPNGLLFLGHSESMVASGMRLHQVAPAVFRKGL